VLVIGATTALFTGFLGVVQNDIKRVVAYSTLSQLGYMTVALGASAYAAGIFHLMTHAFFKALLFLAAGSVIIAMHHEQDIRKMGGLRKYLPVTYITSLAGSLALIGFPGTSGFFSKDALIEAVHASSIAGSSYAYWCVLIGVFVTALYSFRMFFLVFHGEERMSAETRSHLHESPKVVLLPLVLLAIPSVVLGWYTIGPVLFEGYFGEAIFVLPEHDVLASLGADYHGPWAFLLHGLKSPVLLLAAAGVLAAWFIYLRRPQIADTVQQRSGALYTVLINNYYFDAFNQAVLAKGSLKLGDFFWRVGDVLIIDGTVVNGSARLVGWCADRLRKLQTGYLYHYAFALVTGLVAVVGLLYWGG